MIRLNLLTEEYKRVMKDFTVVIDGCLSEKQENKNKEVEPILERLERKILKLSKKQQIKDRKQNYFIIKVAKTYDDEENMMLDIPTFVLAQIKKTDIDQLETIKDYFRHYGIEKIEMLNKKEFEKQAKKYGKFNLTKINLSITPR